MSKPTIAELKKKCTTFKSRLTRYKKFFDGIDKQNPDIELIEARLFSLIDPHKELHYAQEQLMESETNEEEKVKHEERFDKVESDYYALIAESNRLIKGARGILVVNQPATAQQQVNQAPVRPIIQTVKLPDLNLAKFDGSIEKWQSFRGKFLSRIDNSSMRDVDKMQYLVEALEGKAARAVEALELTNLNYKEAWKILTNKYDNSRKAILKHWDILVKLPPLTKDSPEALDELVDCFRQHLRAIQSLGELIETWSPCIIHLLISKISDGTRFQWETTLADNKMPSYISLIDFLEKRANCSERTDNKGSNNKSKNGQTNKAHEKSQVQRAQALVTTNNGNNHKNNGKTFPPCPVCKGTHSIYKCTTFRQMPVAERTQAVSNANLCKNCLRENHLIEACQGSTCRVCNEKHNTYLHPIYTWTQVPAQVQNSYNNSNNMQAMGPSA